MSNAWIKKAGFCTGILLCGVSSYSLMHQIAEENAGKFNNTHFIIGKDTVSMQDFYYNLENSNQGWIYTNKQGEKFNLDSISDYTNKEKSKQQLLNDIKLKHIVDTIYVSQSQDSAKSKDTFIYKNKDAVLYKNMPSMGIYDFDVIKIREFTADDPNVQEKIDKNNNKYNCTFRHEFQHYLNTLSGIRKWNSYPVKYVECCLDEISANLAQCLEQRKNYLAHGKDLKYITKRFASYKQAIIDKKVIPQSQHISEDEASLIINSVFSSWMEEKYEIYSKQEQSRTKYFLQDAPFTAIQEDLQKHLEVMEKIFTIDGYSFWQHISHREQEIFAKITPEMKKEWALLNKQKFDNMTHMEKLEYKKITKGKDSYQQDINANKIKARIISFLGKNR